MTKKYFSIDIGGTNIKYGIIDDQGELVFHKNVKTPDNKDDFLNLIKAIVQENLSNIQGVGISVPGKVNVQTGTVFYGGALPFLDKVSFKDELEGTFQIPVAVENDAKSGASAELWLGSLKDVNNGAIITLGTGVGGGIVLNHQLLHGSHYQAGELSYMSLGTDTSKMSNLVGLSGSAVHMIEECAKVLNLTDEHDGVAVFDAINNGNQQVTKIFSNYCDVIATVILNIQSVVDLETIAISGGISAQPIVVEKINKAYLRLLDPNPLLKAQIEIPNIIQAHFKSDANLYGAVYNLLLQTDSLK